MNNKKLAETANVSVVKKTLIGAGVMALSLTALTGPASAGDNFANVIANAECLVMDGTIDKDVMVTALLEQKPKIGPAPTVGDVTYTLEQHTRGQSGWVAIDSITVDLGGAAFPFPTPAAGEEVEIDDHTFENFCSSVLGNVNALRAVVEVEVTNSNPKRNDNQIHTGRCVSFANPCQ